MKLKGHCKVELKDKRTGKVESYEEHNMVTEFPQELFKQMGYLRPNAFANRETLPIDDLFGGIMCFDTAIDEATDMTGRHSSPLYPPADKEMVANASMAITGNTAPEELGQYNSRSSASTATTRKFIFDWDTDEGLGQIASVCLTSKYGGYKGVGNSYDGLVDTSIEVAEPMEAPRNNIYDGGAQTSFKTGGRVAYINRSSNIVGVITGLDFSTGVLNVKEYDLAGVAINPFKALNNGNQTGAREVGSKSYTFTPITDTVQVWYVVCRYGHWFIVTASSPNSDSNVLNVIKFNEDNTQEQYRFPNVRLGYMYSPYTSRFCFAFLGNYFIVATINHGYQEFNYCKAVHTGTYAVTSLGTLYISASNTIGPDVVLEGRMYIGGSYIIRLKNGQPVLERTNASGGMGRGRDGWVTYGQYIDDPYAIFLSTTDHQWVEYYTYTQGTLMRPYLATIFNLDSPVQKLGDKTLKITYELTLVTS